MDVNVTLFLKNILNEIKEKLPGYELCRKVEVKDKEGSPEKTKTGKVKYVWMPFELNFLGLCLSQGGMNILYPNPEDPNDAIYTRIPKRKYDEFMKTKSLKKRLEILGDYSGIYLLRPKKADKKISFRLSQDFYDKLKKTAQSCGMTPSQLARTRLIGTQPRLALSQEQDERIKEIAHLARDYRQMANAFNNYAKTIGVSGAQRLDVLFQSKEGIDLIRGMRNIGYKIDDIIKR